MFCHLTVAYLLLLCASCAKVKTSFPFPSISAAPGDTSRCYSSASWLVPHPGAALAHTPPHGTGLPCSGEVTANSQLQSQRVLAETPAAISFSENTRALLARSQAMLACIPTSRLPGPSWTLERGAEPRACQKPCNEGIQQRTAAHGHGGDRSHQPCLQVPPPQPGLQTRLTDHRSAVIFASPTHKTQHTECKSRAAPSSTESLFRLLQGWKRRPPEQAS